MRLLILYGSQTGTAQDLAEQIWRESKGYGFDGPVLPMNDYPIQTLAEERLMVAIIATTGNGDEPDNMKRNWKFLLRKSLSKDYLQRLKFACLGLGDSSYSKFNFAAKKFNKRLQQLGAQSIVPIGLCDDQHDHGLHAVALQWKHMLWQEMKREFNCNIVGTKSPAYIMKWNVHEVLHAEQMVSDDILKWPLREDCQKFVLKMNQRTTSSDHFQDVRLLKLKAPDDVEWQPGDIFCVRPCNSDAHVEMFFKLAREHCMPFHANTIVKLDTNFNDMPLPKAYEQRVTLGQLVKYIWDLSALPRQRVFELMALNCDDALEKEKLLEFTTAEGLDDLVQYINRPRRNILEVLEDFRHATSKLSLSLFFEIFTIIQPRSFSIASVHSGSAEGTLDLLVAVVNYKTKLIKPRLGLCSNWLKSLLPGCTILGRVKPSVMSIPAHASQSIIMVGPGTGIAPFRSVIQHRSILRAAGQNIGELIVFFGCRYKEKDFHFSDDFHRWQSTKLTKNFIAFSRDQQNKVYVQHLIKERKELLQTLIKEDNAIVLVSGTSKNMPKDVKEAFIFVMDNDDECIENMIKQKRYQEETWS